MPTCLKEPKYLIELQDPTDKGLWSNVWPNKD